MLFLLKYKHPPLVVFFYHPNDDVGVVGAVGAVVEVVVGVGAVEGDAKGRCTSLF